MTELQEKISSRINHFTEVLNNYAAQDINKIDKIPYTIKKIDKLVNELYADLYRFVDNKTCNIIEDKKCGHCG